MRAYTKLVFIVCAHYIPFLEGSHSRHLRYGLQYLLSFGKKGQTTDMSLHTDCLGNADDPLAKTFDQVPLLGCRGMNGYPWGKHGETKEHHL